MSAGRTNVPTKNLKRLRIWKMKIIPRFLTIVSISMFWGLLYAMQDLRDKARLPKKNNKTSGGKDKSKWHTYHKDFGHLTKDWFSYRKQIIYLLSKGHLKELLVRKRDKINQKPQDPKNLPQIISSPHSDAKVIDFISGGSENLLNFLFYNQETWKEFQDGERRKQ